MAALYTKTQSHRNSLETASLTQWAMQAAGIVVSAPDGTVKQIQGSNAEEQLNAMLEAQAEAMEVANLHPCLPVFHSNFIYSYLGSSKRRAFINIIKMCKCRGTIECLEVQLEFMHSSLIISSNMPKAADWKLAVRSK